MFVTPSTDRARERYTHITYPASVLLAVNARANYLDVGLEASGSILSHTHTYSNRKQNLMIH